MRQIIFTSEMLEKLKRFAFDTPDGPFDPTLDLRQSLRSFFDNPEEAFPATIIILAVNTMAIQKISKQ